MTRIAVLCLVSGRVQGVWYRGSAREKARELNVTGYAKNLPDGRVEVLACGLEPDVNALIEWLWHGPPDARVSDVSRQPARVPERLRTFETR